ncbi:MAG: FAD-binding protein [Clostridia bacterium]|nr:FAD-binding protein [Clostridia bacterium]
MRAAYEAKKNRPELDVLVVTSGTKTSGGSSNLMASEALGINAPLNLMQDGDTPDIYMEDMQRTGGGLQNDHLCRIIADESADRIRELMDLGVRFHSNNAGIVQQKLSGCTKARSLTCGGDTGREIVQALLKAAEALGVRFEEHMRVLRLEKDEEGRVCGASGLLPDNEPMFVSAGAVVLATGGAGRIFSKNVNPPSQMGDGWAMAGNAGCTFVNMEFFQVGPAVMYPHMMFIIHSHMWRLHPVLTNSLHEQFLAGYCGDSVTEDEALQLKAMSYPFSVRTDAKYVDIGMFTEIMDGRGSSNGGIYFDVTHVSKETLEEKAPITYSTILRAGADLSKDVIEVGLVVQNFNGGIEIDENGWTGVPGLFACGEVTGGVHGSDRPGGNNLTDTQVFGYRAGKAASDAASETERAVSHPIEDFGSFETEKNEGKVLAESAQLFYRYLTVIRTEEGFNKVRDFIQKHEEKGVSQELANRFTVAKILMAAEEARTESRGTHYRADYPETREEWNRIIREKLDGNKQVVIL